MKGIIIAGGFGTRLQPLTFVRPKPLVPVANRPFLEYQVELLRLHGVTGLVFATNYMSERIEAHFRDGSAFGVKMQYAVEDTPLGTAGAIRNAASLFPGETVAVLNGDILADFDLTEIGRLHANSDALATITLSPVKPPHPFGTITMDSSGRVIGWHEPTDAEKRALSDVGEAGVNDWINAGLYVLSPHLIDRIPAGRASSIEREVYPAALADNVLMFGHRHEGFWMDVGRPEQLLTASRSILTGKVGSAPVRIGPRAYVAATAAISDDTSIGADCRIGDGVEISRSIVMDGVQIGAAARLSGVIVDTGVVIEDDVTIVSPEDRPTPVIAAGSVIRRGTRIG